jgi:hypothetical protein
VEIRHWNTVLGLKISSSNISLENLTKVRKCLFCETELLVEPLLQLEYRYWAPDPKHVYEPNESVVFVNPPANTQDYDHAYHEAKRLFVQMFGEEEYFLIPTEDDNVEIEEEYLN